MKAIKIENLSKNYGKNKVLKNINLEIQQWDFFWLLGHNWAWKTTMIWIITDLVKKNTGKVEIFGTDIDLDFPLAKSYIWVVPQEFNFDIFMKVEDIVLSNAWFYWVDFKEAKKRLDPLLEKLNLLDKKSSTSRMLSWGMKRRLMIARALIHQPKLLILDEPTAGVDVELRKSMWDFLIELNKQWTTILLTTHYLEEAEQLCNKIAIINKWEIIENTDKKTLLAKLKTQDIVIDLSQDLHEIPDWLKDLTPILIEPNRLQLNYDIEKYSINEIVWLLDKLWLKVTNLSNSSNRLEQLFIKMTKDE